MVKSSYEENIQFFSRAEHQQRLVQRASSEVDSFSLDLTKGLGNKALLFSRENAAVQRRSLHQLPSNFVGKLNSKLEKVPEMVLELRYTLKSNLNRVEYIVTKIMEKLVDEPGLPLNPHDASGSSAGDDFDQRTKRLDRDAFISFGGPELLISLLFRLCEEKEDSTIDTHSCCNEILITLRELCFSEQNLSTRILSRKIILFLFSLLETEMCSNAIGLLEELLAIQFRAFQLSMVPDLYDILHGLGSRQTAHLCRVLALVIFEPEADRLANDRALRSLELLQLRRDRVSRPTYTVDINQVILAGMPELLPRLVRLLQLMNHGPAIDQLVSYQLPAILAVEVNTMMLRRVEMEENDWDFLRGLCDRVNASSYQWDNQNIPESNVISENSESGGFSRIISTIGRWVIGSFGQDAEREDNRINGGSLNEVTLPRIDSVPHLDHLINREDSENRHSNILDIWGDSVNPLGLPLRPTTPLAARAELSLHALVLGHHQVEVLFVICTLIGGRRKRDIQQQLAKLNIVEVLINMFPRLSWGISRSHQSVHRPHGAGCDCDPESALRVQWLRLVHNLVDREGGSPEVRKLVLSRTIQKLLMVKKEYPGLKDALSEAWIREEGLMNLVVNTLMKEPNDSPYRFWLASCVEAFLRGSSPSEQLLIAQSGLLEHLLKDIMSYDCNLEDGKIIDSKRNAQGALQTSFDLLGELTKGSFEVLKMLNDKLEPSKLPKLLRVIRSYLVDSNVFLRNLVISMSCSYVSIEFYETSNSRFKSYLERSWDEVEAVEIPLEKDCFKKKSYPPILEPMMKYEINKLSSAWKKRNNCSKSEVKASDAPFGGKQNDEYDENLQVHGDVFSSSDHRGSTDFLMGSFPGEDIWILRECRNKGIGRLQRFLAENMTCLMRDLLAVVDVTNINHENICCLNTAVALLLLSRRQSDGDKCVATSLRCIRSGVTTAAKSFSKRFGGCDGTEYNQEVTEVQKEGPLRTGEEVLTSFRQLLWFWQEYYMHRGRDRLGIEFNSHICFEEWKSLVELLCADDGSETSLMSRPIELPESPYSRPPRLDRSPSFLRNV